jgi:hypothetical protein
MPKTGEVDGTLRYGGAPFFQRKNVTGANKKRRFERWGSKRRLKLPEIGVEPGMRFNDHPAAIYGLGLTNQNCAEAIQIEIGDVVMALPFEVDVQPVVWGVVVYAYDERCVPGGFHNRFLTTFSRLFSSNKRQNRERLFPRFQPSSWPFGSKPDFHFWWE